MKKIILLSFSVLFIYSNISAQNESFPDDDFAMTAIEKNNHIIDVYYGLAFKGLIINLIDAAPGGSSTMLGPIGVRYQYMVTDDFGIGADFSYQKSTGSWDSEFSDYDPVTGAYSDYSYNATYSITKIKAMIRTSWVFVNNEKFTANWANSIGYRNVTRTYDDPYGTVAFNFVNTIPVAVRSAIGVNFFFTKNIGIHAETGIFGGGWLLGGLSVKL